MAKLHDTVLEQTILGSILYDPSLLKEAELIISNPKFFYEDAHNIIYDCMLSLTGNIDELILAEEIKKRGQLTKVGGYGYLSKLVEKAPSSIHMPYYAKQLKDLYAARRVVDALNKTRKRIIAYGDFDEEARPLVDDIEEAVNALKCIQSMLDTDKNKIVTVKAKIPEILDKIKLVQEGKIETGLPTGYTALDNYLGGGLQFGESVIVAGAPSAGKTSLLLSIAANVSPKTKVLFLSLETSTEAIIGKRLIPMKCSIKSSDIWRENGLGADQYNKLYSGINELRYDNFSICDTASLSIEDVEEIVRRHVETHGLELLLIDYLHKIRIKGANQVERISELSTRISSLIKDNNICSLIVSLLNRKAADQNRPPKISDLRDSAVIEYNADTILLLSPEEGSSGEESGIITVNIAKNRNGETGSTQLYFDKKYTRFKSIENNNF